MLWSRASLALLWLGATTTGCAGLSQQPRARVMGDAARALPPLRSTGPGSEHGAGPKASASNPPRARTELHVRCDDPHGCPSAVGLLVVEGEPGSEPERCTTTLIAPDKALTASHCLAPEQRHAGASCAQTWLAFPETADAAAETVSCARVLSAVTDASGDALHQEHAILLLDRPLARRALEVDATPPDSNSIVTVVSITPHPVYGSTHALRTRLCRSIDSEPAQAVLGPSAANVGWLASCPIARGNSGSPVLDTAQRIRAIVHGGTARSSGYAVTSAPVM
jgi:hypothetical protein